MLMTWKYHLIILFFIGWLGGCSHRGQQENRLISVQTIDRNGFRETINSGERLEAYQKVDFLTPQPYEQVMRLYNRTEEGKSPACLTIYHENGQIYQYLEVLNGRASGLFREWYPNGRLHIDAVVIEGLGSLSKEAQLGWVFDGICRVFDEQGALEAEFNYEKGLMEGLVFYYFPSGRIKKQVPYKKNLIDGMVLSYNEEGAILQKTIYKKGKREGLSIFKGDHKRPPFSETYKDDLLLEGIYHDFSGGVVSKIEQGFGEKAIYSEKHLASIEEYQHGIAQGKIKHYDEKGNLYNSFMIKEGLKHGEEWVYFPSSEAQKLQPKLYITWVHDRIHGIKRTWYQNGTLESETEMSDNQKQGVASAWYQDGSLMFVETYHRGRLVSGEYREKGKASPISYIEEGQGKATLFDSEGYFLEEVFYEKGVPLIE